MRKNEQIKLIMDAFDFKKVHSAMTFLNIKWRYDNGERKVPSIADLQSNAEFCLHKIANETEQTISLNAGGLEAIKVNGALGLKFVIESVHPLYALTLNQPSNEVATKKK